MDVTQRPRNFWHYENAVTGESYDLPCFTCRHCGRVKAPMPRPDNRTRAEVDAAIATWWATRSVCKKCMGQICELPGCHAECRPLFVVDGPLAYDDVMGQPWLFRDRGGYPVDRVYDAQGAELLVRRKDNGLSQRELARMQRGAA